AKRLVLNRALERLFPAGLYFCRNEISHSQIVLLGSARARVLLHRATCQEASVKLVSFALTFFLIAPVLIADDRNVDYDPQADFSKYKTFMFREGEILTKAPDLNSPLVRKKIDAAIRAQLVAKGLREVESQGDLVVTYRLGAAQRREVQNFPAGR